MIDDEVEDTKVFVIISYFIILFGATALEIISKGGIFYYSLV